jgi:hypothetical protein
MGDSQGRLISRWPTYFYLDASLQIDVCRAFTLIRDDIRYPTGPECPITSFATLDHRWLPIVGREDWVVIMRDKQIRYRAAEKAALLESGVRAFRLTGAGQYTKWRTVDLLVRKWPEIEEMAELEAGPYIEAVTQGGLRRVI